MDYKLKISIVVNLCSTAAGMYIDWYFGYDGQNYFVLPFLFLSLVLTPLNIIWTIVFMVKAKVCEVVDNAIWILLTAITIAPFFLPRFPR